jgi:hypothetical protein
MKVLLDHLGHTRRLWTKGHINALHGLREITLNRSKSGEDWTLGGEREGSP